ncbi:MAG: hypothetical protein SWJ54_03815 [Cyanobacteriota bacterium]|nr:hypothetical protein [Cyanobacteriota bacterium]
MISDKLLELENEIQTLTLEDKLWLLDKIMIQLRENPQKADVKEEDKDIQYDNTAKPIWEIAVEIGSKIPESGWEKVPRDLSKNFDLYIISP